MKISRCIGWVMVFALVGSQGNAAAQTELEITPHLGAAFYFSDLPSQLAVSEGRVLEGPELFDRSFSMGLSVGLPVTRNLSVEAGGSWQPANLRANSGLRTSVDVNVWEYGVNGIYKLPAVRKARPFVGLGLGRTTFDYHIAHADSYSDWSANALVGVLVEASDRSAFRIQVRDRAARMSSGVSGVGDAWTNSVNVSVGLTMRAPVG